MQVFFYREREVPGIGALEDILQVQDGQPSLKSNCLPGSAQELAQQARFFGGMATVEQMTEQGFDVLVKRLSTSSATRH